MHSIVEGRVPCVSDHVFFFFNDTATTEIYTLSLHDALPIFDVRGSVPRSTTTTSRTGSWKWPSTRIRTCTGRASDRSLAADRKSTRLNSSHANISYAVFCLKKKNNTNNYRIQQNQLLLLQEQ